MPTLATRCDWGNQSVMTYISAGKRPASATPSRNRRTVEGGFALHEHHRRTERAPRDRDARDPGARSDPVHDQVARDLQQRIAEEEDPGAEAEGGGVDADDRRRASDLARPTLVRSTKAMTYARHSEGKRWSTPCGWQWHAVRRPEPTPRRGSCSIPSAPLALRVAVRVMQWHSVPAGCHRSHGCATTAGASSRRPGSTYDLSRDRSRWGRPGPAELTQRGRGGQRFSTAASREKCREEIPRSARLEGFEPPTF